MTGVDRDRPWLDDAACKDLNAEVFFPTRGEDVAKAKQICYGCPVRSECLEWALAAGEHFGIWGATSERERKRIRKTRRLNPDLAIIAVA